MGCVVFFELFSIETRYFIIGLRTQGIGGILFAIGYFRLIYQLKDKELTVSF
jgi:mRNA-degrading endonuclease RelE of RelBE toxin-antitoxin system